MMAKCISLSNYNLSSTNVLIIGAGKAHAETTVCVLSQTRMQGGGVCVPCTLCHPSSIPSLCKGSHQRVFLNLFVLHANDPKVLSGPVCRAL